MLRTGSKALRTAAAFIGLMVGQAGIPGVSTAAPVYLDSVSNREWRQVMDTVGYSFNDMNSGYGSGNGCSAATGACLGNLGATGPSLSGWTWATEYDVRQLFGHFGIPGFLIDPGVPSKYTQTNSVWAPYIVDVDGVGSDSGLLDKTAVTPDGAAVMGLTRTSFLDPPNSLVHYNAIIMDVTTLIGEDVADTTSFWPNSIPLTQMGFWLYRESAAAVPIPATALLVLTGMVALGWRRRPGLMHQALTAV
jgi:hypothetical protein